MQELKIIDIPVLKQSQVPMIDRIDDVPAVKQVLTPANKEVQKVAEVSQVQYIDKIVDIPVQKQRQVPMIQTEQKTIEVPQVQFTDTVAEVPVQKQRQEQAIQTVQKIVKAPQVQFIDRIVEAPQVQYIDKIADIPMQKQRQVPIIQTVQKSTEVPQMQFTDRVVDVPVQKQRQVPAFQTAQKVVEVPHENPQTQYIDKMIPSEFSDDFEYIELCKQLCCLRLKKYKFRWSQSVGQQHTDKLADVPVPMIQKVQETVEEPQIQYIDKIKHIIYTEIATAYKNAIAPGVEKIPTAAMPSILQMFKDVDLTLANITDGFEARMKVVDETLERLMSIICNVKEKDRATNDRLEMVESMVKHMAHELWD